MRTLTCLALCCLCLLLLSAPALGGPDDDARAALALARRVPQATAGAGKPSCRCGDSCPTGGCPGGSGCLCLAREAAPAVAAAPPVAVRSYPVAAAGYDPAPSPAVLPPSLPPVVPVTPVVPGPFYGAPPPAYSPGVTYLPPAPVQSYAPSFPAVTYQAPAFQPSYVRPAYAPSYAPSFGGFSAAACRGGR